MKILALGALCAVTLGFVAPLALAQTAPVAPIRAAQKSGYDLLLETQGAFWNGPNGSPLAAEKLAPAEDLRRQRLAVENNAPLLAKTREALRLGIAVPAPDPSGIASFRTFATVREIARQFAQEADVRAADGDAMGAANSSLDSIELGAQFGRGSLLQWLVGEAVTSIGRKYLVKHAPQLNAAQSREVAARLERVYAARPTLEELLRAEQRTTFALSLSLIENAASRAEMQANLGKPEDVENYSYAQLRQILALDKSQLEANTAELFDAAVARVRQPYQRAAKAAPLRGADPLTDGSAPVLGAVRFGYERGHLADRFAVAALKLHAIKLETGAYPATFEAGNDPFSPDLSPLIYRRDGESYLLYSIGPDGLDDGGADMTTSITDPETGAEIATNRVFSRCDGRYYGANFIEPSGQTGVGVAI